MLVVVILLLLVVCCNSKVVYVLPDTTLTLLRGEKVGGVMRVMG